MFTLLAEVPLITINVGNLHLAIYLSQLMYFLVAAIVGFVAARWWVYGSLPMW